MLNFSWLDRFFKYRQQMHCPILPNHRPRKNGECTNYINCSSQGRTDDHRCQNTRKEAYMLGDGLPLK